MQRYKFNVWNRQTINKKTDLALQYERMLHEQFAMQVSFRHDWSTFLIRVGVVSNVDNAVVSFVGVRFARPKTVCFVSSDRQPLPLQLKLDRPV